MPPKKERSHLKVIKIPLDYTPEDISATFPPLPVLYLELFENKQKIKPELRNKDYISNTMSSIQTENTEEKTEKEVEITFEDGDIKEEEEDKKRKSNNDKKYNIIDFSNYKKDLEDLDKEARERERRERERRERKKASLEYKEKNRRESKRESKRREERESKRRESKNSDKREEYKEKNRRERERRESRHSKNSRHSDRRNKHESRRREEKERDKNDTSTDTSKRLEELLRGSTTIIQEEKEKERDKEQEKEKVVEPPKDNRPIIPPRLSDIEKGEVNHQMYNKNNIQVRDIVRDDDEVNKKRELLFRFDILRRSYKGAVIPEYSEYTDLITMQKSYDDTVRRLSLDSSVDSYKKYLIGGFMMVEFVLGNWFKFDMNGFTQQQMLSMSSYDKLLIELGEKSYLSQQSNWPVEARLLVLIIVNATVFIITKMVFKSTGTNFMNMINSQTEQPPISTQPKKKMRGPDINLSDLSK